MESKPDTSQPEGHIPTHSSSTSRADLHCCCGREECAFLQNNHEALKGLEKDLETAARLGQVRCALCMFRFLAFALAWAVTCCWAVIFLGPVKWHGWLAGWYLSLPTGTFLAAVVHTLCTHHIACWGFWIPQIFYGPFSLDTQDCLICGLSHDRMHDGCEI